MGRLDADRSHLPVLPLHRRHLDRARHAAARRSRRFCGAARSSGDSGLLLAAFPFFRLSTVRITGVLARIAWCYVPTALARASGRGASAAAPHRAHDRRRAAVALLDPAGRGARSRAASPAIFRPKATSARGSIARSSARICGAAGDWDPEGLLSTVPAIATTMIGLIAGWFIAETRSPRAIVARPARVGPRRRPARPLREHVAADQQESLDQLVRAVHRRPGGAPASRSATGSATRASRSLTNRLTEPFVALGRNAILLFVLSGCSPRR